MHNIKLRPYQQECLDSIIENYEAGKSRQLVALATGAGKTVIFASLIYLLNKKTLVLAHTCELLEQAKEKIKMIVPWADVGIVNGQSKGFNHQIVVSSIQSASKPDTLSELKNQGFTLCIYDEAHRAASNTSKQVIDELGFLSDSERLIVGFSATPFRNDDKSLGDVFKEVVFEKSIKDLINLGYLCKPIGKKIRTDLDLSNIKIEGGDFKTTSLASVMNTEELNDLVVKSYVENGLNRSTVCFCVDVEHAKKLAEKFSSNGISSKAIYGSLNEEERSKILSEFENGSIQVLTNCQILTEGWDCPKVSCVIVAKPTQSKGLYQQMCGRGLRLFPNKQDCLILDFGSISHSLCNIADLTSLEIEEERNKAKPKIKYNPLVGNIPSKLNKKLKTALLDFDPVGEAFYWMQEGASYYLKGSGNSELRIASVEEKFNVLFMSNGVTELISIGITFDYAFSIAEDYAKENRRIFSLNDLEADWRNFPISEKQISCINALGFKAGVDKLTRGQAAIIINRKIKKAVRN